MTINDTTTRFTGEGPILDSAYASRALSPGSEAIETPKHESNDDDLSSNSAIASKLKGKVLEIPKSLLTALQDRGWPAHEGDKDNWSDQQLTRYQRLYKDAIDFLQLVFPDSPMRLQKAIDHDYALFTFHFFPEFEDYEDSWTAGLWAIWLFTWDDEVDVNDGPSSLSEDFEIACAFRRKTVAQIKTFLGLDDDNNHAAETHTSDATYTSSGPMIAFEELSRRIVAKLNRDQRQRFYEQLALFIQATETEHAYHLSGHIFKTVEEMFPNVVLPSWVTDLDEMKTIEREQDYLISIYNDILSIKKEIANNSVNSMVPILYLSGVPWEEIVQRISKELLASGERFDQAAESLLQKTAGDAQLNESVRQVLHSIRTSCTGTIQYSLLSRRYNSIMKGNKDGGDVIRIVI
ncbi:isoprenoid synthase domain-containing protein [Bombardia bombarda]|uniref:Isoprenoid synthase domain-containing protein n=1 Tax=Bombardia bombarda TaxID=252184 RepID=A0AA39XN97_9PEZI|nr:isoprenoid synthase domain-containing protein [Bombardia bombarda]